MKYMLQYPDLHGASADLLDAGSIVELSVAAERAGFEGMTFTEHPAPGARWLEAGGHQTLDPFVALGAVAAVTERMRLLTYLAVLPYRNPLLVAKAATTVDRISNGRFVLGAGTGYLKSEFFALGVDFEERNRLFDEALDVMPMHWSGEPFSYEGTHFTVRDAIARPRPTGPIPIWLGGNSKLTLRRVAERAQGWMPLLSPAGVSNTARTPHLESPESIAERLRMLEDLAGDRFGEIEIAVPYYEGLHLDPTVDAERHRDHLGRLAEIGVDWAVIGGPWAVHPGPLEFVDAFAATYFPRREG